MSLIHQIAGRPRRKSLIELAETVANDCHWEVWNRIVGRVGTMASAAEAESYIRTRAARIVRRRAEQVIACHTRGHSRWVAPVAQASLDVIATRLSPPLLHHGSARAA